MKDLIQALVKAKSEFKPIKKEQSNPFYNSKYANLEAVIEGTEEALINNGLVVIQTFGSIEGKNTLVTSLAHTSGQIFIGQQYLDCKDPNDPQKVASASTYARRYGLMAILGISTEDDDGNGASKDNKAKEVAKPSPEAKTTPASTVKVTMKPVEGDIVGQFISKVTEQKYSAAKKKNYNQTKYYVCTDGVDTFENITCFKDIDCKANDNLKFIGIKQWTRGEEVNFSAEKVEIIKEEIPFGEMDDIDKQI